MHDYLKLHLVIIAWGFTAILGKLIQLPAMEMLMGRTALAAVGFGWVLMLQRGDEQAGRVIEPVGKTLKWVMLGLGVLLGLHWVLFFLSTRLATASVTLAAMPTAMMWCSLLEPLVNGSRRWRPLELVVGGVMLLAVWLIYEVEFTHWWGFTVALISALFAALFSVLSKQFVSRCHYAEMGAIQMVGALGAALVGWVLLEGGRWVVPSLLDCVWLLLFASICTVWAYAGYMDVLRRLSVFTVNVIYNLEPVYGILLAALIFGEEEYMSGGFYVGAALIIGAVLVVPWLERWVSKKEWKVDAG